MPRSLSAAAAALLLTVSAATAQSPFSPERLNAFTFREIGPAVTGGRIHDVEVHASDKATILIGTASGGMWKTTNAGTTWRPVFDDQPVSTFGDIAFAPSDPSIVYAGTGEQNNRQSTSWGNGVYRSNDGGETWTHLGLDGTAHIGRVIVHPSNPDIVWVAAQGNLWRPTEERGVYRTRDGGRSWQRVLYVDTLTGASDLAIDPNNPDVLYAGTYQRLRRPWGFNGGGPGSGIWKSTDGGDTWARLTSGIPSGDKGRIGLAMAPSDPRILYAAIEHADSGGIYRSNDGGESWARMSTTNQRPMYYSHLIVDPNDAERVYQLAVNFYRSDDGGRTFRSMPISPTYDVGVHADHHALWIDPDDSRHLVLGGDGGLWESWDMGESFTKRNTLPIAQIYDLGVDMRDPYYVYIGLQDNHSWLGPSATRHWAGILHDDWKQIGFSDGMYQQVDPTNHRYVYSNNVGGGWSRVDSETGDILNIRPAEPEGDDYRFDWASPSLVSMHDPATVYVGGNRLFISRDRGFSWERTEDLTRQVDRDTLTIMGVRGSQAMLSKNDGESNYSEITSIAESPLDANVLWVGVDDGNVQVSRDGGRTWTEVSRNMRDVPYGAYVSRVVASRAGAGVAYVTFDNHRMGDWTPYAFRTSDYGATWTRITNGLPSGSVNAIAEDPVNPNVLYLGTEHALFASADAGRTWTKFAANLPTTLYDDIVIHPRDHDLILGTHGRGVFILDDARPLAQLTPDVVSQPLHLFPIRPATPFHYWKDTSYRGQGAYAGTNPPSGAILTYHLGSAAGDAALIVTNARGEVVRRLEAEGTPGLHRTNWDLRWDAPPAGGFGGGFGGGGGGARAAELAQPIGPRGPFVSPGTYTVTLEAGGRRVAQTVEVRGDPLVAVTDEQHREREAFLVSVLRMQQRVAPMMQEATRLRRAAEQEVESAGESASPELRARAERAAEAATRLQTASRTLGGIGNAYNGSAVRPGSMYGPTRTHMDEFARVSALVDEAERLLADLDRR